MKSGLKLLLAIAATSGLAACHADPFGLKPEANVHLPEKPPVTEAPAGDPAVPVGTEETAGLSPS